MIFALHGSRSWRRRAWILLLLLPPLGDSAKVAVVDVDQDKRQRRSWGCLFAIQAGGESACFVAPAELRGSVQATVWPTAKPQACATAQRIACMGELHHRADPRLTRLPTESIISLTHCRPSTAMAGRCRVQSFSQRRAQWSSGPVCVVIAIAIAIAVAASEHQPRSTLLP